MFVQTGQRRAKAMCVMRQFVSDSGDQNVFGDLGQLQKRVQSNKRRCIIQREANQSQAAPPGLAKGNFQAVRARHVGEMSLPYLIKMPDRIALDTSSTL